MATFLKIIFFASDHVTSLPEASKAPPCPTQRGLAPADPSTALTPQLSAPPSEVLASSPLPR